MGCQAPMSCAFCGTMRRNWVVSFQASNRISNMLLIRARRGARGNDATKRVTKPNCITVKVRGYIHRWSFHLLKISICEHVHFIYSKCGRWRQDQVAELLENLTYEEAGAQQHWKNLLGGEDRKMLQVTTHQEQLYVFKHPFKLMYLNIHLFLTSSSWRLGNLMTICLSAVLESLNHFIGAWVLWQVCWQCCGRTQGRHASSQEISDRSWWLQTPSEQPGTGLYCTTGSMEVVCLLGAFLSEWAKKQHMLFPTYKWDWGVGA